MKPYHFKLLGLLCAALAAVFGVKVAEHPIGFIFTLLAGGLLASGDWKT
jgi:hypothetical protein